MLKLSPRISYSLTYIPLILKPSFFQSLSLYSHLSLPRGDLLEFD